MTSNITQLTYLTLRITPNSDSVLKAAIQKTIPSFQGVFPDLRIYVEAESLQIPKPKRVYASPSLITLHDLPAYEENYWEGAPDVCLQLLFIDSPDFITLTQSLREQGATLITTAIQGQYGAFSRSDINWETVAQKLVSEVYPLKLEFELLPSLTLMPRGSST